MRKHLRKLGAGSLTLGSAIMAQTASAQIDVAGVNTALGVAESSAHSVGTIVIGIAAGLVVISIVMGLVKKL